MDDSRYESSDLSDFTVTELLDGLQQALNEIRGDWTDPRHDVRRGWAFLAELRARVEYWFIDR